MNRAPAKLAVMSEEDLTALVSDAVQAGIMAALKKFASNEQTYMNENEAGKYLGISPVTLRAWRMEKKGPRYHKFEKAVRYAKTELDAWMKSREMLTIDCLEARRETSC